MNRLRDFRAGFSYIGKGFRFFWRNKKLWWYAIIPTLINILVLIGLIFLLIHYYENITTWLFGKGVDVKGGDMGFIIRAWKWILTSLLFIIKAVIFLVFLILIFIGSFVFSLILTEPFNDELSEKVEILSSGSGDISFSWSYFVKSLSRSVVVGLQKAGFFIVIPLLLLVLNLLPLIGGIIYLILANLFAAFDIGFNFADYPMSRKLWSFRERISVGWKKRYHLMGFGIVALVPLFPYIFAAPLVTGGTLMFSEVLRNEQT